MLTRAQFRVDNSPHSCYNGGMRHVRWIPFTFLAGVHGFALFAPYAAIMLGIFHLIHRRRR